MLIFVRSFVVLVESSTGILAKRVLILVNFSKTVIVISDSEARVFWRGF